MKDYDVVICILKSESYESRKLEERLYEVQKKIAEEADEKCHIRKSIVCGDGKAFVLEDVEITDIFYVNEAGRDYSFRQAILLGMTAFRQEADGRYLVIIANASMSRAEASLLTKSSIVQQYVAGKQDFTPILLKEGSEADLGEFELALKEGLGKEGVKDDSGIKKMDGTEHC